MHCYTVGDDIGCFAVAVTPVGVCTAIKTLCQGDMMNLPYLGWYEFINDSFLLVSHSIPCILLQLIYIYFGRL